MFLLMTFKWFIFVVKVFKSMIKILREYFSDDPVFIIGSYSEIYRQNSWKIPSKKSIFKVGSFEYVNEIFQKYLWRISHFTKPVCIFEQNLWYALVKKFFF